MQTSTNLQATTVRTERGRRHVWNLQTALKSYSCFCHHGSVYAEAEFSPVTKAETRPTLSQSTLKPHRTQLPQLLTLSEV